MEKFQQFIMATYGSQGKNWLAELPNLIEHIAKKWDLSYLSPLEHLSYHYLLKGFQQSKPVILKLGLDITALQHEALVLNTFSNCGVIQVLAQDLGALLLECAIPGTLLKVTYPSQDNYAVLVTCKLIQRLQQVPSVNYPVPTIQHWLEVLNKHWDIPKPYLTLARKLRDNLLSTATSPILLHGDLHHDNILKHGENWVIIDPKGVMGEPIYEVAAYIRNPIETLFTVHDLPEITKNRILAFSKFFNYDPERIHHWCFVQAVLSWIWAIEDNTDYQPFKKLTELFKK